MKLIGCIVLLLFVVSCSKTETSVSNNPFTDLPVWTLEQDLLIEESDDLIFGYTMSPQVTSDGEIIVADFQNSIIHHFDSEGDHLGTFSGKGSGPGEIDGGLSWGIVLENDNYLIFDRSTMRFTEFTRQNDTWIHTEITPSESPLGIFFEGPENTIITQSLVSFNRSNVNDSGRGYYVRQIDRTGKALRDSLLFGPTNTHLMNVQDDRFTVRGMPAGYGLTSITKVFNKKTVVHASTDAFKFTILDLTDNSVREIQHAITPVPLTSAEKDTLVSQVGDMFASAMRAKIPDFHRAMHTFQIDDKGLIWVNVNPFEVDETEYNWVIMNMEGELLAKMSYPENVSLANIQNDMAYGSSRNSETGTSIHRYRIIK
jgi:hypothetical protein